MDMTLGFLQDVHGLDFARKVAFEIEYQWTENREEDHFISHDILLHRYGICQKENNNNFAETIPSLARLVWLVLRTTSKIIGLYTYKNILDKPAQNFGTCDTTKIRASDSSIDVQEE
jgi:hypothetical protein